jgi:hypothetical protein
MQLASLIASISNNFIILLELFNKLLEENCLLFYYEKVIYFHLLKLMTVLF